MGGGPSSSPDRWALPTQSRCFSMNTRVVCGEPEMYSESAIDVELRFAIEIAIEMWDAAADCPMNDYFYGLLLPPPSSSSPAMLDQRLSCVTNRVPASIMLFAFRCGKGGQAVAGQRHCVRYLYCACKQIFVCATLNRKGGGWQAAGRVDGWTGGWSVKVLLWNVTHVTKAECEKLVQTMRPSMVGKLAAPK